MNYEQMKNIFIEMGLSENEIAPEKKLIKDLAFDSTEMVEFVSKVEKNFKIKFTPELHKIVRNEGINKICDSVKQQLGHSVNTAVNNTNSIGV